MFDYEKIMQENTVVHCDTEEKANDLLKWADEEGLRWDSGGSYLHYNFYSRNGSGTCYYLYKGEYCSYGYYDKEGYKILTYEEVKILEILAGVDKTYEVGDYGIEWVHSKDYEEAQGYSSVVLSKDGINVVFIDISKDCENGISIDQANNILRVFGAVIVEKPEAIKIKSDSGQELEISVEKARELGFDVK